MITECPGITKCDKKLLEIVMVIRKCEIQLQSKT